MRTFTKWLEDHKLELPTFSDVEQNSGKDISEKASKNFGFNYPAAYKRGQYMDDENSPSPYFMSKTADALYKMTAKPRKEKDTAAN
jgi:hypothetical protein